MWWSSQAIHRFQSHPIVKAQTTAGGYIFLPLGRKLFKIVIESLQMMMNEGRIQYFCGT